MKKILTGVILVCLLCIGLVACPQHIAAETKDTGVFSGEVTLLKVLLVTGRTHQIRAHLSSVGHPILGDHKYGDPVLNARVKEEYHLTHQLLHAAILTFPKLEGTLAYLSGRTFQAPLPKKFARILTQRKLSVEGNAEHGTAGKEETICRHGIPEA